MMDLHAIGLILVPYAGISAITFLLYFGTGFLAIPGFSSPQEISDLRKRAEELVDGFDPSSSSSVFSTRNQVSHYQMNDSVACAMYQLMRIYNFMCGPFIS